MKSDCVPQVRHYPTAKRIADALLSDRAVLNLRSRTLVGDIRRRFDVSPCTARHAIGFARPAAGLGLLHVEQAR